MPIRTRGRETSAFTAAIDEGKCTQRDICAEACPEPAYAQRKKPVTFLAG